MFGSFNWTNVEGRIIIMIWCLSVHCDKQPINKERIDLSYFSLNMLYLCKKTKWIRQQATQTCEVFSDLQF